MKASINDVGAFEQESSAKFVDSNIKDIVNDAVSSAYQSSQKCTTYVHYSKMLLNSTQQLPVLESLIREGPTGKSLGILQSDCSVPYNDEPN